MALAPGLAVVLALPVVVALIERIKKGDYTLDEDVLKETVDSGEFDDDYNFGETYGIIWNGPKPDYKGYDKAVIERQEAYKAAKDTIWVKSPEDGLAAVEAFKDWKPTNAPKQ